MWGDYMNDIVNIISTVGFPICSCLLYMGYIYKDKQQTREENAKREEKLIVFPFFAGIFK